MENKQASDSIPRGARAGFTLIEILVGGTVMLIVVLGTLFLHMRSNQISVDQQQFAELQHDVRSSMYFISRDLRSAGVGIPIEYAGYFMEGEDNEDQGGVVQPDRLLIMGNIEDPLYLTISSYAGNATIANLEDFSFERYHYLDDYYADKIVLVLPNPESGCISAEVRRISSITHPAGGTGESVSLVPGMVADIVLPGAMLGTCADGGDYNAGGILFIEVKEYWLDVDGSYPGLTAGVNGYIGNGEGGILYMTQNGYHYPMAQNIENLQFEYNGDFDNDGLLDGWSDWNPSWIGDPVIISRIHQIRLSVLGRTADPYHHVSSSVPTDLHLFRRPVVANTPAAAENDMHRRYLMQSSVSVRNLTIEIYNTGIR